MSLPSLFDYMPDQARALCKMAEEVERTPKEKARGVAKSFGTGLLGFATGSLAGVGSAYLLDKAFEASTGSGIL